MTRTTTLKTLMIVVVLAVVAAACTGGGSDGETEESSAGAFATEATTAATDAPAREEAMEDALAPAVPQSERDALGSGGTGTEGLTAVDFGRDIIFTAQVTVAVTDVAVASAEATNAVQSLGGFVFGQTTTGGAEARSTLVFKIEPANFQAALAALGTIGEVRTQSVTADDVTDRVVDLQSRISTAEASVERLKEFLTNAGDIDTIAELEAQLLDRETTLEVLRGQLRTLQDAVSLATITVTLTEALSNPAMSLSVTAYPSIEDDGVSCPGSGAIDVLEGETVTVCFELTNVGDTLLTDFEITDAVLGVQIDNLTNVWGDSGSPLEPGQTLIFATDITVERTLRGQTRATATPVNADGDAVEAREVSQTESIGLFADQPEGLPGFQDGLSGSLDLLQRLGGLLILLAGVVIPFAWVVALYVAYRFWKRRNRPDTSSEEPMPEPEGVDL